MIITEEIREKILKDIPELRENPDYISLYFHLLYGDNTYLPLRFEKSDGRIRLSPYHVMMKELIFILAKTVIKQSEGLYV